MKAVFLSLSLLIATVSTGIALNIVTPEATFKDVKVTKVEAEAVRITHSEGTALVDFDLLPPAMQAEYGWTPEKSAARKEAREAEVKRIADEEKMIEEAPKRKAMEEEAKKKAEERKMKEGEEKLGAEEKAKLKMENAAFESESRKEQEDLIAAAAKMRAEIDRERNGGKVIADEVPVAAVLGDKVKEITETPAPKRNIVTPGIGSVSDALVSENPLLKNYKVWMGILVGLIVVVILFMLPAGGKTKLTVKVPPRR